MLEVCVFLKAKSKTSGLWFAALWLNGWMARLCLDWKEHIYSKGHLLPAKQSNFTKPCPFSSSPLAQQTHQDAHSDMYTSGKVTKIQIDYVHVQMYPEENVSVRDIRRKELVFSLWWWVYLHCGDQMTEVVTNSKRGNISCRKSPDEVIEPDREDFISMAAPVQ